jgi:ketosteroid isomerase-like protein
MRYLLLLLLPVVVIVPRAAAQQKKIVQDSAAVLATMNAFVKAFSSLNWETFTTYFADDVTAFFPPSAKFAYRANNKTEVLDMFRKVFDNAGKGTSGVPHIDIRPTEIKIQLAGGVAIASFLLHDPGMLGRRTIIWQKIKDKWLIIHLHASGVVIDDK